VALAIIAPPHEYVVTLETPSTGRVNPRPWFAYSPYNFLGRLKVVRSRAPSLSLVFVSGTNDHVCLLETTVSWTEPRDLHGGAKDAPERRQDEVRRRADSTSERHYDGGVAWRQVEVTDERTCPELDTAERHRYDQYWQRTSPVRRAVPHRRQRRQHCWRHHSSCIRHRYMLCSPSISL